MATDGPLTPQQIAVIRAELERRMEAHELSQADVAEAVGSTATYINGLLRSAASLPEKTRDELWRAVRNWLERELRAEERERPKGFVRTVVAERVIAVLNELSTRADMAVVYGPAGIGKTETVAAMLAEFPDAILVRVRATDRTPTRLLWQIGRALVRRRASTGINFDLVVDRLRKPPKVKTRSILIVDEAHELPPKSLRLLRDIFDEAGCSILLVGTVDVRRMVSADADREYGQISSRVGMRINLSPELTDPSYRGSPLIRLEDIRRIFDRAKVRLHPAAARLLMRLANEPGYGALRRAERIYDKALRLAERAGATTIEVQYIQLAQGLVEDVERDTLAPQDTTEEAAAATA